MTFQATFRKSNFAAIFALLCAFSLTAAAADVPQSSTLKLSHVRIVRLSFTDGDVTIRREPSGEWAAAVLNTPIEEGFSLATGADGYAEVEFENGSTARIGDKSQLDFTQLAINQQGDKLNVLTLSQGFATFHFMPQRHDDYAISVAGATVKPQGKAEFRADVSQDELRLEVFEGDIHTTLGEKTDQLGKNKVITYALSSPDSAQPGNGVQKDAWDKWNQARDQQALLATNEQGVSPNGARFGWSDLGTYGAWGLFPGYGYAWAPYEPAGWSPYSAGMWSYYPGWGYTWVSGEPWGWLPFHNGNWNFDPAMGWFWSPGEAGAWSPALVNWYQGSGWVGWAPAGAGGRSVCAVEGAGCITAVSPVVLQNGQRIQTGSPVLVHPASLAGAAQIAQPGITPGHAAMLSGAPISSSIAMQSRPSAGAGAAFVRGAAPARVVIGHQMSADEFLNHHGFMSGPQAIHAPAGRTMGGVLPTVVGSHGEFMPDPAFHGASPGAGNSAASRTPAMISRGSISQNDSGEFVARSQAAAAASGSLGPAPPSPTPAAAASGSMGAPASGGGRATAGGRR